MPRFVFRPSRNKNIAHTATFTSTTLQQKFLPCSDQFFLYLASCHDYFLTTPQNIFQQSYNYFFKHVATKFLTTPRGSSLMPCCKTNNKSWQTIFWELLHALFENCIFESTNFLGEKEKNDTFSFLNLR